MCVTEFWKTDRIVTLGLFLLLAQLMATLVNYTYAVPALSGLADWSASLEGSATIPNHVDGSKNHYESLLESGNQ